MGILRQSAGISTDRKRKGIAMNTETPMLMTFAQMHKVLTNKTITNTGAWQKYMPFVRDKKLAVTYLGKRQRFVSRDSLRDFLAAQTTKGLK